MTTAVNDVLLSLVPMLTLRGDTIDPDMLIIVISDEWDRLQSSQSKGKKGESDGGDDAMGIESKNRGKGKKRTPGPYWICEGPHLKRDCPKRKKDDEKNGEKSTSNKKARGANAVDEDDEAFSVEVDDVTASVKMTVGELEEFSRKTMLKLRGSLTYSDMSQVAEIPRNGNGHRQATLSPWTHKLYSSLKFDKGQLGHGSEVGE